MSLQASEKELGIILRNSEAQRGKHPAILPQEAPPSSEAERHRPSAYEAVLTQRDSVF